MRTVAEPISRLIEELNKLPGIGPKSAKRLAYHLLQSSDEEAKGLAEAILTLKEKIKLCSVCFNNTDCDPCHICQDKERDHSKICVVEKPSDVLPLEQTGKYDGVYHVLHGTITPTEGVGPGDLKIKELLVRLKDGSVFDCGNQSQCRERVYGHVPATPCHASGHLRHSPGSWLALWC